MQVDGGSARDGGGQDGGVREDGGTVADGGGVDGGVLDASVTPEDCATSVDEDGNGYAGCDDPGCWETAACVEEQLTRGELAGWTSCGAAEFQGEEQMALLCEAGFPDTIREVSCRELTSTATLQMYCAPSGEMRALRWVLAMDVTQKSETLSPRSVRTTDYSPDLGFAFVRDGLLTGEGLFPVYEAYTGSGDMNVYRAVGWHRVSGSVLASVAAVRVTTTHTIQDDGTVDSTRTDPVLFLSGAFEAR